MSWRVLDITLAMAYAMLSTYGKTGHRLAAAAAMRCGFHSSSPLTPFERQHLKLLVKCRLCCSSTLGAFSYQQNPENKYLLLHAQPAWDTLTMLTSEDENLQRSVDYLFDVACEDANIAVDDNGIIKCSDIAMPDPHVSDVFQSCRPSKRIKCNDNNDVTPAITFVTGNKKKLEEVKRILSVTSDGSSCTLPFQICNHKLDLPELQGEVKDIAREKCKLASEKINGPVITEDTSLCYNALHGLPGPYIKWFLEKTGHEGLNRILDGYTDRSAYAQTLVAFCAGPGKHIHIFDGCTSGIIVSPRGKLDFGWDPVFEPLEGSGKTYAEMSKEEKDAISHRSRAFSQLREFLIESESVVKEEMKIAL